MKIFPIDKTLKKIFDEAEEKFKDRGVTRDQIKEIFYLIWYNSKLIIHSNKFPSITLPKWGRFVPKVTKMKRWRDYEENEDTKKELTQIIERLNKENKKRKRK